MTSFLLESHDSHGHSHHSGMSEFLHEHLGRFGEFLDEVVLHGIIDTLSIVAFLFLTYLLLEVIEHKAKDETVLLMRKAGRFGPVVGGLFGVIPQCGFSTVAANLYTGGIIGLGTLIAVFLSTSDDMLVVLLSGNVKIGSVLLILLYKMLCGILVGFIIDLVIRAMRKRSTIAPEAMRRRSRLSNPKKAEKPCDGHKHEDGEHGHSLDEHNHEHADAPCGTHGHEHSFGDILKCALRHTLSVSLYIFIVTVVLNSLIFFIGEDAIAAIFVDIPVLSHLIAAIVGLVPNCAVSVALTRLALSGIISEGVMISGLLAAAGVGLLVLIRTNSDPKEDIIVPAILVVAGTVFGLIADLLPFITIF